MPAIAIRTSSAARTGFLSRPAAPTRPEMALPEEMSALHRALGIERVVIVTPSVYGTDNSATLYGMKARGANARGIAVIDEKTPESDLDAMGQAGVRGIRLNLATAGPADPAVGRQRFQAGRRPSEGPRLAHSGVRRPGGGRRASRTWFSTRPCPWYSIISAVPEPRWASNSPASPIFSNWSGGQGIRQALGRLSRIHSGPGLSGRDALRQGAHRRQRRPHRVGHGLAASRHHHAPRPPSDGCDADASDRRRPAAEPARRVGADAAIRQKILVDNPARLYGF